MRKEVFFAAENVLSVTEIILQMTAEKKSASITVYCVAGTVDYKAGMIYYSVIIRIEASP